MQYILTEDEYRDLAIETGKLLKVIDIMNAIDKDARCDDPLTYLNRFMTLTTHLRQYQKHGDFLQITNNY